jgi:8-oxo-dGTP pyrophosphatase MutT (NUDIX family)
MMGRFGIRRLKRYRGAGCLLYVRDEAGGVTVFAGKRRFSPGKGSWSIPGGGWEKSQDGTGADWSWNTASRETREETGIDLSRLVESVQAEPDSGSWPRIRFRLPFFSWDTFLVELHHKVDATCIDEFSECKWYPLQGVPEPLAFGMRRALRRVRRLAASR